MAAVGLSGGGEKKGGRGPGVPAAGPRWGVRGSGVQGRPHDFSLVAFLLGLIADVFLQGLFESVQLLSGDPVPADQEFFWFGVKRGAGGVSDGKVVEGGAVDAPIPFYVGYVLAEIDGDVERLHGQAQYGLGDVGASG